MNAINSSLPRGAGLLASLALLLGGVSLQADTAPKQLDAFPLFDSYIKISGRAADVTGNPASFAKRFQRPDNGSYGLEALHISRDINKDTAMEFDGRALAGAEDYLGKLRITKNEMATFEVGYKRFRTFYDDIGGFFPLNNLWLPVSSLGLPEELHTDRAKLWADLVIARPNAPVFHFRYANELRNGSKDTTIWGDSDLTGIPIYNQSALNPISANRKLVPAYIDLNERQETWEASMRHTVGNTEFEFEIVGNNTNSFDTRWTGRYPGEVKLYPAYSTSASPAFLIPALQANNQILGFDSQMNKADIMNYTGKFETKLSDRATLFGGLSYQHATADIGGDRQMFITVNTGVGQITAVGGFGSGNISGRPPYSYTTVTGYTKQNILTGNLGLNYRPNADLYLSMALKGEDLDMDGLNQVTYINTKIVPSTGVQTSIPISAPNNAKRSEKSWVPEFEIRYTGIKDLALYGILDYRYSPGEQSGTSTGVTTSGSGAAATVIPSVVSSFDNVKLNHGHYKVGANWTVSPLVALRAEMFYKDHTNKYSDVGSTDGFILGYEFYGTKLTAIMKPAPNFTLTGRYVGQSGKMHTQVDGGTEYRSMDTKNHLYGATIDWTPSSQGYLQANINVVSATTETAYPRAAGATPAANLDVLRNSDNDYWNGSIVAGFVVDKNTDAQLVYTVYRADNYNPALAVSTLPYGAGVKEYTMTLALKHKFTARLIGSLKLGYFDSKNDTTGGNTNFKGPMGYLSFEHAL